MVEVAEIMTSDLHVTSADATVRKAAAEMVQARVGSVLVMTGSALVGILTERDVLRAAASDHDLGDDTVRNWMTPDPVTASPDTRVGEATETMLAGGFRHLPVLDAGQVVGMVSLRDLLSARIHRRA